ncbi:hypothetical protein [Enterobacter hormaechei]|uniref:hypothetical protein n=1 Tax=Enterobacter hormaechei TaxID=158836 RepID=UPI0039E93A0E
MANELSEIQIRIEDEVYKDVIKFPKPSTSSIDVKYQCNKNIKAKAITYTNESNGKKEVVKNEQ